MRHSELEVWKRSIEFVTEIYRITTSFPKVELYGLTAQIRRAAVSVPSNIAEGATRGSDREFIHFLSIAMGSLSELETQLIIAKNLGYLDGGVLTPSLDSRIEEIRKPLIGLIHYLEEKVGAGK